MQDLREVYHLYYEKESMSVCGVEKTPYCVTVRLDRLEEQTRYLRTANIHNVLIKYCNKCLSILR